jgi:hypothetical protein
MRSISFFSLIFRRPVFSETTVSIWDGQNWLFIESLPKFSSEQEKYKLLE